MSESFIIVWYFIQFDFKTMLSIEQSDRVQNVLLRVIEFITYVAAE